MSNINDVKIGINQVLDTEFQDINIYAEEIKQGFEEPCFFVKILNSSQNKELNRRYKKNISFDIHYFSDKEDINSDCNDIADKLYEVLEYIRINSKLYRAVKHNHEVIDGVLHFFLEFNYHVFKEIEAPVKMNKLKQRVGVKHGQ
jgi:hypothetical protein